MPIQRIPYSELNSRQRENYNFQKLAAILADYGFNCIKLSDDWQGADFLAYHIDGINTLRVQLKGRMSIDRKYIGKNLHMAFPSCGDWYLIDHDHLVQIVSKHTNWLNTSSWIDNGIYNSDAPSKILRDALKEFRIESTA
ncbi:MAG TPA: hypothetical protein PLA50_15025 [Bacteroidia bacterium]|nr:hypothetical protein [Bacteroidia bacterium]